jgi:hypothetical protein
LFSTGNDTDRTIRMEQRTDANGSAPDGAEKAAEQRPDRSYVAICADKDLAFDPMKDLNLPSSYDEVVMRFRRLQGVRAMEVLN